MSGVVSIVGGKYVSPLKDTVAAKNEEDLRVNTTL